MTESTRRQHLFISHHHEDDAEVTKLTKLLTGRGWDIRNSSIRVKKENQERLDKKLIPERTLKRLLRMKISWASTVVVLIGSETHKREWVNWEIDQANAQGKNIVGVFVQGGKDSDVPPSLEKYGASICGWNSESILSAIEGQSEGVFENPDGTPRKVMHQSGRSNC